MSGQQRQEKIDDAITLIYDYGAYEGEHHKQWVLDQVIRLLMDEDQYDTFRMLNEDWDEGIAP